MNFLEPDLELTNSFHHGSRNVNRVHQQQRQFDSWILGQASVEGGDAESKLETVNNYLPQV